MLTEHRELNEMQEVRYGSAAESGRIMAPNFFMSYDKVSIEKTLPLFLFISVLARTINWLRQHGDVLRLADIIFQPDMDIQRRIFVIEFNLIAMTVIFLCCLKFNGTWYIV